MPHETRTITAKVSPAVEARIVSSRTLVGGASDSTPAAPVVTAGSGMARLGASIFVAQDDSTSLAVIGDDGCVDAVRLFDPISGKDRFVDALGNKRLKPDMEAIAIVRAPAAIASRLGAPASACDAVLVLGSGSLERRRDHIALVFVATPLERSRVVTVYARALYEQLRGEAALVGEGQLNVEGAAVIGGGRTLRLFNRGSGQTAITASVDLGVESLLDYLARAKSNAEATFDAPVLNPTRYDLGRSAAGFTVSITDATVIPAPLAGAPATAAGEIVIVSAVAEETNDATLDGATSNTMIGVMPKAGSLLIAPLTHAGAAASLKVEGLAVREAAWVDRELRVRLAGITDPDATELATASVLVEIDLIYRAR